MLSIAYEVLSDSKKRKNYDMFGEEGVNNQQTGGPSFNFNFNDFFKRETAFGGGFNFDNIFNMFEEEGTQDDVGFGGGLFDGFSPFGDMGGFGFGGGIYHTFLSLTAKFIYTLN